jgi:AraC-like DNA-binding protein
MQVLYDTNTVRPLDRYDYYRAAAATEIVPVTVHGSAPGHLFVRVSIARVGEFEIGMVSWAADSVLVTRRTERLIRAGDPGCYRICLCMSGAVLVEQDGNQVGLGARDLALFDLSRPYRCDHGIEQGMMQAVMLTFPRTLVPLTGTAVRSLTRTVLPRNLLGRSLVAQFLAGLADTGGPAGDPGLADVLRECVVGLIRQRLGQPAGFTPHTSRLLQLAHVRNIMRRHLGDPALDVDKVARFANISPGYLHKIFQGAELTPMQLLKRMRLEECHRRLQDPASVGKPLKEIVGAYGYRRPDQFARDFKQLFGVPATQVRRRAVPNGVVSQPG